MSFLSELGAYMDTNGIGTAGLDANSGWGIYGMKRPANIDKVIVLSPNPAGTSPDIPTTGKEFQVLISSTNEGDSEVKAQEIIDLLHRVNGVDLATIHVFGFNTISGPFKIGVDENEKTILSINFVALLRGQVA